MEISAGIAIILNNEKILLAHPTNNPWKKRWGIPKGKQDENETLLETALRETKEEVGIHIKDPSKLEGPFKLEYVHPNKKVYKIVYYFIYRINDIKKIELNSMVVPKNQLQMSEVDYAEFKTFKEAEDLIMRSQEKILVDLIK